MAVKNALGKGLGAMFPDLLENMDKRPSFVMCGIEELSPNRFQARRKFGEDEQQQLVASIKKNGIIQPIIVRKTSAGYEIIAGERRWRAAQKAGMHSVPIIIREAGDIDAAELSLIENIQREDLNPIEEAEAYQMLIGKFGLSVEDIAARAGKDRSTVANTVRLLKLPAKIRDALIAKKITNGHARPLLGLDSPIEQLRILDAVIKEDLSVRDTERLIQKAKIAHPSKKKNKDHYVTDMEKAISNKIMARVQIHATRRNTGRIEIGFNSMDDLNRLIAFFLEK